MHSCAHQRINSHLCACSHAYLQKIFRPFLHFLKLCFAPYAVSFFAPFLLTAFDEHVRRSKTGGGNSREMDFESFLDFVLALENKDTPEGLTYLFRCLDLHGRGHLTTADIHTLFRWVLLLTCDQVLIISYWLVGMSCG